MRTLRNGSIWALVGFLLFTTYTIYGVGRWTGGGGGTSSGSGTPGGANTQVQFNDSGSFGGDSGLTFVKATDALAVNGAVTLGSTLDVTSTASIAGDEIVLGAGGIETSVSLTVSNTISATSLISTTDNVEAGVNLCAAGDVRTSNAILFTDAAGTVAYIDIDDLRGASDNDTLMFDSATSKIELASIFPGTFTLSAGQTVLIDGTVSSTLSVPRFHVDDLVVVESLATKDLKSIYLNADGPAATVYIYAHDGVSSVGAKLFYDSANARWSTEEGFRAASGLINGAGGMVTNNGICIGGSVGPGANVIEYASNLTSEQTAAGNDDAQSYCLVESGQWDALVWQVGDDATTAAVLRNGVGYWPGLAPRLTTTASATSITAASEFVSWVVTGNVAIELPDPSTVPGGMWYRIKATNAAGATVKSHNDTNLIDGSAATHALAQYESCDFQTDGTNWYRMAEFVP